MPFHKVIGIDLGTTYSAVTIWDGKEVHVIESAWGTRTIPSVIGLDPQGDVIVGAPAQNNLVSDPENTVIEIKREMGVYEREPRSFDDPGVPLRVRFRGRDYLPQELSAFILMELKRQAETFVGEPIHDAVITVPAYFKEPQRGATEEAARMARLNVRRLLNEPTAAAVCFGADKVEDSGTHIYAVYDLGGGTFDVSIIQVSPSNVSVVGTGGDARLGGGDFDDRIVDYVLEQIRSQHSQDLSGDAAIRQRIKREAEMRKRDLSVAATTTLNLPYLTPTLSANITLTRARFEELIKDLLDRSLRCLDDAIESARQSNSVEAEEIEQVLLVGGSSRIACIRPMLAAHLGLDPKDVRGDISPEEVVARGAGIIARDCAFADAYEGRDVPIDMSGAVAEPQGSGIDLQDVTSHSLGILANRSDFVSILPKDSRIPNEVTQDNFINGGPDAAIDILIYQGEQPVAWDNTLIGKLPIVLPEARERGHYRFAVTFSLDLDGLLNVGVRCLNDNQIWRTDLQCSVRTSRQQIDTAAVRLQAEMVQAAPAHVDLPPPPRRNEIVPPPPPNTPDEFKAIARRSYKRIPLLEGEAHDRLLEAYLAFVAAVIAESPDVETCGDRLDDLFHELRQS